MGLVGAPHAIHRLVGLFMPSINTDAVVALTSRAWVDTIALQTSHRPATMGLSKQLTLHFFNRHRWPARTTRRRTSSPAMLGCALFDLGCAIFAAMCRSEFNKRSQARWVLVERGRHSRSGEDSVVGVVPGHYER